MTGATLSVGREFSLIVTVSKPGVTVLDRVHQSMILFATGRGEALRRFPVEDGVERDAAFWKLSQFLKALSRRLTGKKVGWTGSSPATKDWGCEIYGNARIYQFIIFR